MQMESVVSNIQTFTQFVGVFQTIKVIDILEILIIYT